MSKRRSNQICSVCGKELPISREFFKRSYNKELRKEIYHTICRKCEETQQYNENWKNGKLKCFSCGKWLYEEEFDSHTQYKYRNNKDKRCKKCKQKQNKEARLKYDNDTKLFSLLSKRWLAARSRALSKNIPFTITKEYLVDLWNEQEGKCAVSGIPMTYEIDNGRIFTNVSVDQKNPGQGYTNENTQLICQAVNQLKSDWDMDTVLYICKQIVDNN